LLFLAGKAQALNYVYDSNQDYWAVNDAATPGLDTGSIMRTATGALQGYGRIRMQVNAPPRPPLAERGADARFRAHVRRQQHLQLPPRVSLGGVAVTRSLNVNQEKNYARFLDTSPTKGGRR